MPVIAPTKLWIADVPMEFIEGHAIEITISRGIAPSLFAVKLREDGKADKALKRAKNPVAIKIECADHTTIGIDSIELKNWYIVSRKGAGQGVVVYTIADQRWAQSYNKLTAEYNIVSYGGLYRPQSLKSGTQPWKALIAAEDALKKLGYDVAKLGDVRFSVGSTQLPDNMGNDPSGGGWVGATQDEVIPPMLGSIACDPVPLANGKISIVDRFTEKSKNLKKYAQAVGDTTEASVVWQEPSEIIVPFRKRIERLLNYTEGASATATEWDFNIDNVMPDWRPGQDDTPVDHKAIADWINDTSLYGFKYIPLSLFRQRYLKRQTFDLDGGFTAQALDALLVAQSLVRQCYWLRFRIRPITATGALDDVRGNYSDVRLERLKKDGTGRPAGVFMDYTRKLRFGKFRFGRSKFSNPLDAQFSEGVRYNFSEPAPAKARWLDRENLVFEVVFDSPSGRQVVGYIPGRLEKEISYGGATNFRAALAGTQKFTLDDDAALRSSFRMSVFWHGLWTKHGTGDQSRTYDVKVKGNSVPQGRPSLTARVVPDMTANFGYDNNAQGAFPGDLLNDAELQQRAKQIAAEIKASLKQKRAGVSTHVGINVLTRGKVWVDGDIHEIKIVINGRKLGSVETRVSVLPGRRPKQRGPVTGHRGKDAVESARIL